MRYTILDCYTDEPAGLGVPPYLGVYPRYIYGRLASQGEKPNYITIDDLRNVTAAEKKKEPLKTNIRTYNLTRTRDDVRRIIGEAEEMIVILGVHTPGKYLSAVPGTLKEVMSLLKYTDCKKTLTGPAVFGTQLEGGRFSEKADLTFFDKIEDYNFGFSGLKAEEGAELIRQIPEERIIEIETGRGCPRIKGCSFCMEPVKHKGAVFRKADFVIDEIKSFYGMGCRYFRLGKQSCFFSYPNMEELLKGIWQDCPDIKVLHIDNVNPAMVDEEKTKAVVKYCTPGNVAAFGVESFDRNVITENNLNSSPKITMKAIRIINELGAERGSNGMQKFLPGINILFGLKGESKKTHDENMRCLKQILDENLLIRRINIRQVNIFEGTQLFKDCGNKFIRKNKQYYWKWRNEIRQQIDYPMLQRLVPEGTILKDVRMEVHDGNTTFGRQMGTYPLIAGIKERLPLKRYYNIKVTGHMLRSVTGEAA